LKLRDPGAVDLAGDRETGAQFVCKTGVEGDRRVHEEIAIPEAQHRHARREREWKPYPSHHQILEGAIDHADVRLDRRIG
jgi:hypothetical protein